MTVKRERQLRTTQRAMLRKMLRSYRQPGVEELCSESSDTTVSEDVEEIVEKEDDGDAEYLQERETWIEWMQRTTFLVEDQLRKAGLGDWVVVQRKRQWTFAGHVARRTDGRWSRLVLGWVPVRGRRYRGHPSKRWSDEIDFFF